MNHFYNTFIYAFTSLFAMLNPIGMSVIFSTMTKHYPAKKKHLMAYRVAVYSGSFLILVFFLGPSVLNFFGVSLTCIQVAGGMLVVHAAWNMLTNKPKINYQQEPPASTEEDITFFPLMMPITAGPGSLAVTVALSMRFAEADFVDFVGYISTLSAIVAACFLVALCYRFADNIFNKLGLNGTNVISKLAAFILLAIGIGVTWEGVIGLITPLLQH